MLTSNTALPVLSADEVVTRLSALRARQPVKYSAFYSSQLGRIVTDPALMVIPFDDHMVHRGHGIFDTANLVDGKIYDLDAHLDWALEAWRTCRGLSIADRVSDLVQPVGVAVLVLATGRALWHRRPAREVLGILASLAVGTLLIGALKDVLDRPRPGAEAAPGYDSGTMPDDFGSRIAPEDLELLEQSLQ